MQNTTQITIFGVIVKGACYYNVWLLTLGHLHLGPALADAWNTDQQGCTVKG